MVTVVLKRAKRPKPRNSTQIQKISTVRNGKGMDPPSCSNISRRDCEMASDSCTARLCIVSVHGILCCRRVEVLRPHALPRPDPVMRLHYSVAQPIARLLRACPVKFQRPV